MPIQWRLKKWLAVEHDIYRASELRKRILDRTGTVLSNQTLGDLLNSTPKALKLSTMEILCTTFQCTLSEFFDVVPGKANRRRVRRPYAAHGKRKKASAEFPDPANY